MFKGSDSRQEKERRRRFLNQIQDLYTNIMKKKQKTKTSSQNLNLSRVDHSAISKIFPLANQLFVDCQMQNCRNRFRVIVSTGTRMQFVNNQSRMNPTLTVSFLS